MFSLEDLDFDYMTTDGYNHLCDEVEKVILSGTTISADTWKAIYHADVVNIVDERTYFDEIDNGWIPTNVYFRISNKYFTFWYDQSVTGEVLDKFYDLAAVPVHKETRTIEVWEEGE